MRYALLFGCSLVIAALGAACGGSSSESPWPLEPDAKLLGPAGESSAAPVVDVEERPDGGKPAKRPE